MDEFQSLVIPFALVAVAAVPVGLACRAIARRQGEPIAPRWRPAAGGWAWFDAAFLFAVCFVSRLMGTAAGVVLAPAVGIGFNRWRTAVGAERWDTSPRRVAADAALGVLTWLWLTPATFAVYALAVAMMLAAGVEPDKHPLVKTPLTTAAEVLAFLVGVCAVGPYFEEMQFRRVLVPWAARRRHRPWAVMAVAGVGAAFMVSVTEGKTPADLRAPLVFLGVLAAGLLLVTTAGWVRQRFPVRTTAAVWATAALFSLMHSGVWPSPVPLFVLGLGLGWLVARTRAVTAAAVTHGLFNAVSAVHLLRGGQ